MNISTKKATSVLQSAIIVFLAYSAVYAFRKPFTAGSYNDLQYGGITYQTLLIIAQVIGYMLSKFAGIRFIAGMGRTGRWKSIALLMGIAWICLFIFAIIPPPFGVIPLFVNGFVLGFLWGIVFSYIEGRTATDFMGTVMAVSFIFAGGFTRSVARWITISWGVSDFWMPFITGLVFVGPLALLIYLLEKLPQPDQNDIKEKSERTPMTGEDRKTFLKFFSSGLIAVAITYLMLTVMRDIRDNYMSNMWDEMGYAADYGVYVRTETISAVVILLLLSLIVYIRNNYKAFIVAHWIIGGGLAGAGIVSFLFLNGLMAGHWWMQLTGLGLYFGYILFNCIFFERMIATFRIKGNVGFVIYFVDAIGYLGSVTVMISKSFFPVALNWSKFYANGVIIGSVVGVSCIILSMYFFRKKFLKNKTGNLVNEPAAQLLPQ
jgi:hypothetical protein